MADKAHTIALIGLGTIGLSFCALHILHTPSTLHLYDPRPDLLAHIQSHLPIYLASLPGTPPSVEELLSRGRLKICATLEEACAGAAIVQEQGPENLPFKQDVWAKVLKCAPDTAHFWSSTSGIFASQQVEHLDDKTRLLVVHPFNPPHILPLIEIVPSPHTQPSITAFAQEYFATLGSGHRPVVLKKEKTGFVGNRLAFALLREAMHLVNEDVVSAADLDAIVESSMGPRWAVAGPFKTYHLGGGAGGLGGFLNNLGGTIQGCWEDAGTLMVDEEGKWKGEAVKQAEKAYGSVDAEVLGGRDRELKRVVEAQPKR